MGDTVKLPDSFDLACFRLLHKTAELVSKTSAHALVVFSDSKNQCQYFASPHLQTVFLKPAAATFFRKQLVQQFHDSQIVRSNFIPLRQQTACAYVPENKKRAAQWANSTQWLRRAAKQIAATYSNRAFFMYIYGGDKLEKHQVAAPQLSSIFDSTGWAEFVQSLVNTATAAADEARPDRDGSMTAGTNTQSKAAPARKRPRQSTEAPAASSDSAPKRVAKHAAEHDGMAAPGNADWFHAALSTNPATYMVPLTSEAWALPDYNVHSKKLVAARPVQVCQNS